MNSVYVLLGGDRILPGAMESLKLLWQRLGEFVRLLYLQPPAS